MLSKVDKHSGVPAYLQIMNIIKKEILLGGLNESDQLPPVREMATIFGVNMNTVMRSLEKLSFEGIVESEHGVGYFIRSKQTLSPEMVETIRDSVKHLRESGLDLPMILLLVEELWKKTN